ncbi:MAG: imidazole glycerol phosphate synthase subunit HisH [Oscillospiraceae bacterium]|nr:imidazole glycerol phosphate synthase subunit HisH [Oscillospiraceae bacterium]
MIAVVDYGVGNLFSLCCSLERIGADAKVTSDPAEIRGAEKIILPGVGAFADAAKKLRDSGLDKVILEQAAASKEIMGICLGMQLLFEKSYEFGEHTGLGLLKGSVIGMEGTLPTELKIPHIGWNALHFTKESKLLKYIKEGDCVYFVHSFYVDPGAESVVATAEYGKFVTAAVQCGNVMGCQFHPEKSGEVGLNILRAFCEKEETL